MCTSTGSSVGSHRAVSLLDILGAGPVRGGHQGDHLRQMADINYSPYINAVLTRLGLFQATLYTHVPQIAVLSLACMGQELQWHKWPSILRSQIVNENCQNDIVNILYSCYTLCYMKLL